MWKEKIKYKSSKFLLIGVSGWNMEEYFYAVLATFLSLKLFQN